MKKKNVNLELCFDFWKDNRNDQHFVLSSKELVEKFKIWKQAMLSNPERGQSWYEYYYGQRAVLAFIAESIDDGLSSVFEQEQFDSLYNTLREHFRS